MTEYKSSVLKTPPRVIPVVDEGLAHLKLGMVGLQQLSKAES